ncbi:MAG: hypothetical protein AAFX10_02750 [Pseudomonadota bacterium]
MAILLQTLFDITLLRKGPEHIPASWILFGIAVLLRTLAVILLLEALNQFSTESEQIDLLPAILSELVIWLFGLMCFGGLVVAIGKRERLAQTLTALVGIGAIVTFVIALVALLGGSLFSAQRVLVVMQLGLLWSVVVKGHIMARATDWHWYAGLLISVGVLLLQLFAGQ